eukprot:CAMPEP_0198304670 /NCGR_PEP_ID=MMETSP1449-20131203/57522_1 /TAXON_ID=420275 /ORGANISM="Attheya septentrionalis, Strain CCMP2084" /LENGTH=93 /DNA_ID=CAMNT_0044007199 /DNA_START=779 /DNA_END=1060 /DNA_ORIENTATION=+
MGKADQEGIPIQHTLDNSNDDDGDPSTRGIIIMTFIALWIMTSITLEDTHSEQVDAICFSTKEYRSDWTRVNMANTDSSNHNEAAVVDCCDTC